MTDEGSRKLFGRLRDETSRPWKPPYPPISHGSLIFKNVCLSGPSVVIRRINAKILFLPFQLSLLPHV